MAFNAGAIEATLTLDRNPFTAGLAAARAQARAFAAQKFEVPISVRVDNRAVNALQTQINRIAGRVNVSVRLQRESLQTIQNQINRSVGTIQVRARFDRTSLDVIKAQVERSVSRIQVRALFDRNSLTAIKSQIERTVSRIQVSAFFDRASLDRIKAQIDRTVGRINVRALLDNTTLNAIRDRISRTVGRIQVRVALDQASLLRVRAQIERLRPTINVRVDYDRGVFDSLLASLNGVVGASNVAGAAASAAGNSGARAFSRMDNTVRAVLISLPLLLPVAGSAITGVIGLVGGLISAFTTAGLGVAAFGLVAKPVFDRVNTAVTAGMDAIKALPPALQEAAMGMLELNFQYARLVEATQDSVALAMASGFRAAAAALVPLRPLIIATAEALAQIGQRMTEYFNSSHYEDFVNFISGNMSPILNSLFEIVAYGARAVMELTVAFMPLAQWLLSAVADGMQRFAEWTATLAGSNEFNQWLSLVKDSLEAVWLFLSNVVEFIFKLAQGLAPLGNVILTVLGQVFDALAKMPPEWLAGIAMGLSAIFAALLLGATGPVALVAGALAGAAVGFKYLYDNSELFRGSMDRIVGDMESRFVPIFKDLADELQTRLAPVLDGIASTFNDKVIPAFERFYFAVAPIIEWLIKVIGGEVIDTIEALGLIFDGVLMGIAGAFDLFAGLFTLNWETFWNGLKGIGEGALQIILGAFGISLDEFYATLSSWGETTSQWWTTFWEGLKTTISNAIDAVIQFFVDLPGNIADALVALGVAIYEGAQAAWNWLVTAAQEAGAAVITFVTELPGNIAYALGFLAGTLYKAAVDGWSSFVTGTQEIVESVITFVLELPGKISEALVSLGTTLYENAVASWNSFTEGLTVAAVATLEWVMSIPGKITELLAGLAGFLLTSGQDSMQGLLDGFIDGYVAVTTFFEDLPGNIVELLGDVNEWLFQTGLDVIQGFQDGVDESWNNLVSGIGEFVERFIQGFKDALGIASPSTVFSGIGTDVIQGFLDGLESMVQSVLDFFTQFGADMEEKFSTALDNMQTKLEDWDRKVTNAWSTFWGGVITEQDGSQTEVNGKWNDWLDGLKTKFDDWDRQFQNGWNTFWGGVITEQDGSQREVDGKWSTWLRDLRAKFDDWDRQLQNAWNTFWGGVITEQDGSQREVQGKWGEFMDGLFRKGRDVWETIKTTFANAWDAIERGARIAANLIGLAWRSVANFFREPINWVINVVLNDGIIGAWNTVMGWIGADRLNVTPIGPIPTFAEGGKVQGGIPNKDSVAAYLMPGEYVLSKRAIANMGGLGAVDQIHKQARLGGVSSNSFGAPQAATQTAQALMRAVPNMDEHKHQHFAYGGVQPHVARAGQEIERIFGRMPGGIGGVGGRPGPSDHPSGHALDFMTLRNFGLGDRIASHFLANSQRLLMKYIIWKQRINSGSGWRGMEDRGSITANHFDHPHVSFLRAGQAGKGFSGGGVTGAIGDAFNAVVSQVVTWWSQISDRATGLFNGLLNFGEMPGNGSLIGNAATEVPKAIVAKVIDQAREKASNLFTTITGMGGGTGAPAGPAGTGPVVDQVRAVARGYGWDQGVQWNALSDLIRRESSWNPTAQNPSSTAYGLFQFLNSTWATVGATKTSNPGLQAQAGLKYIQGRYRNPVGAIAFHNRNNYYDEGGMMMPGPQFVDNQTGKPERVLTPQQTQDFSELIAILQQLVAQDSILRGGLQPLIGNLNLTTTPMATAQEIVQEVNFGIRNARRRGPHA